MTDLGKFTLNKKYRVYSVYSEKEFTDFLVSDNDGIFTWINMAAFKKQVVTKLDHVLEFQNKPNQVLEWEFEVMEEEAQRDTASSIRLVRGWGDGDQ